MADLGEQQAGQRRELRRLEHDGVAGRDRRQDLPGGHLQRIVPRRDRPDHADRFAPDRGGVVGGVLRGRLALEVAGGAGEEGDVVDGARHVELPWPAGSACPRCRLSSCAISSARSDSSRANVVSTAERSTGVARDHSAYAVRAACTARSTSSAPARVISLDDLAGARVANDAGLVRSARHSVLPSMNWLIGVLSLFVGCVVSSRWAAGPRCRRRCSPSGTGRCRRAPSGCSRSPRPGR